MCNRYALTVPQGAMRQLFDVAQERDHLGNAEPLPAIYPKQRAPGVRLAQDGARELATMHWGFPVTPERNKRTGTWNKPRVFNNTRDDGVRTKSLWKPSFEARRCLIPASSFSKSKGRAPATIFWFGVESPHAPLFAFAGIWRPFQGTYDVGEVEIDVYSMMTTTANDLVKPVHPSRMPVILDPTDYKTWLSGSADEAFELLKPFPANRMEIIDSGVELKSEPATTPWPSQEARYLLEHQRGPPSGTPSTTPTSQQVGGRGRLKSVPFYAAECYDSAMRFVLMSCSLLAAFPAMANAQAEWSGRAQVIDGDSLYVGSAEVRLSGIDSPEFQQRCDLATGGSWACSEASQERLTRLAEGRMVVCRPERLDRFDRVIATCWAGDTDLGGQLVAEGLAWAYRRYSMQYAPVEDWARTQGLGVWRDGSRPTPPWVFRAERRAAGATSE